MIFPIAGGKHPRFGCFDTVSREARGLHKSFSSIVKFMSQNPMITAMVLAKRSEVSLHTVRHYTRIGLLKPARHPHNDYKIYQPSDEIRLRFISAVKDFGFTLSEIAQIFSEAKKGERPCPAIGEMVACRVAESRRKIAEMKKVQKKMENALGEWASTKTGVPDGDSVRRLVESVAQSRDSGLTYD